MQGAELYRGPLEEFVRARAELARRLRTDGDREAAAAVAGLRKPSLGAWVVDQLAAWAPDLVRDLLAAASDAREAQRRGAPEALREASARVRGLLDEAGRRARGILEQAGHPATDATVRRARTTAQAAAAGAPAEREALLLGILDRDLDPPGFGPVGEPESDTAAVSEAIRDRRRAAPVAAAQRRPGPDPDARAGRVAELEQAVQRAEGELAGRRRDADRSAGAAARQRARAERLAAEARVAEEEAVAAERAAAADQAGVRGAQDALESARGRLHRALPG